MQATRRTATGRAVMRAGRVVFTRRAARAAATGLAVLAVLAVLALLTGCPPSQSTRCKRLCQRQIECVEQLARDDVRIDETECTSACNVLERDADGKKRVDEFAACVDQASDCEALLYCRGQPPATRGDPP